MYRLKDLPFDKHVWRLRFAFLPVKRVKMVRPFVEDDGYYWLRIVFEVRVGMLDTWTAYAHYNDKLQLRDMSAWWRREEKSQSDIGGE